MKPLYLDTARLGQMSPRACRASVDFSRFAAEYGGDLYLMKLLTDGHSSWPHWLQDQFSGLEDWQGISQLKEHLRQLAQAPPEAEIAIASRSSSLMQLGARLISEPCRNVLVTDLSWPGYQAILMRDRGTQAFQTTLVPIREKILREGISATDVVKLLVDEYRLNRCDGLFLPLIDNLGVRLPIRRIVRAIESTAELRFVLVDGAQALGQIPLELDECYCDLLIASCQKWLRAYSPLGVGYFNLRQNPHCEPMTLNSLVESACLDDPLACFIQELETGCSNRFGETVPIAPLFNVNAACVDSLTTPACTGNPVRDAINSNESVHGWSQLAIAPDFASKATVFEAGVRATRKLSPETIRKRFFRNGIVVSAYEHGLVRVSEPHLKIGEEETDQVVLGFCGVPQEFHYTCR
jgi:hypothetical protein